MWMQDRYAGSLPTIQRTARLYQALSDACGSLSLLSLALVAGLAEPQPLPAFLVALAGAGAALISRVFIDCSTGTAPCKTDSNPSQRAGTWATVSHGTPEANHTSRWNRIRNVTGGRI